MALHFEKSAGSAILVFENFGDDDPITALEDRDIFQIAALFFDLDDPESDVLRAFELLELEKRGEIKAGKVKD